MSLKALIKLAIQAVCNGDEDAAVEVAKRAIAEEVNPVDLINLGFKTGMTKVGDLFAQEEISLPSVIVSAEAMNKAIAILEPHIPKQDIEKNLGTVVIGTMEGDIHDIGKRIVATMLRVYGFEVYDLGRDVPISKFVEKAKEVNADIIASSALMTTTMGGQKILEEALNKQNLKGQIKTMIGGAACTQTWSDKIGCDCYAEDANETVRKAKELVS
jgi:trimethylamine corrinoid protein